MGDLGERRDVRRLRSESIEAYQRLFAHTPTIIAVDRHPDYLSTKLGRDLAAQQAAAAVAVQHHHAHIAACLAENGSPCEAAPVIGIALDGLGYGDDGTLWGGEFLLADYRDYRRLATFKPVAMPGGAQAIREPWRNTYAHTHRRDGLGAVLRWTMPMARLCTNFCRQSPCAVLDA